jgi:hypothetical protein
MRTDPPGTRASGRIAALGLRNSLAQVGLTTQAAAAAALGVSQPTISLLLAGKSPVQRR